METARCFVAVPLPDSLKEELGRCIKFLEGVISSPVRWVQAENIHLTLKFLGDTSRALIPDILGVVHKVAVETEPFSLEAIQIGGSPRGDHLRVVWAEVNGDLEALARLQAEIEKLTVGLGFEPEKRRFVPHLTLGRVRRSTLRKPAGTPSLSPGGRFRVDRVALFESELKPTGAEYTVLGWAPLGSDQAAPRP